MNDMNLKPVYAAVGSILKDQRAEIDALFAKQKERIGELQREIDQNRITLEDADKRLVSEIERELTTLNTRNEAVQKALDALEARPIYGDPAPLVEALERTVGAFREEVEASLEANNKDAAEKAEGALRDTLERFSKIDNLLGGISDKIEEEIPRHDQLIQSANERIDKLREDTRSSIDGVNSSLRAAIMTAIDALPAPKDYDEDIEEFDDRIADLAKQLAGIDGRIEKAQGDALSLITRAEQGLSERVDALPAPKSYDGEIETLAGEFAAVDAAVKQHASSIADIGQEIEAIEPKIAEVRETGDTRHAALDASLQAAITSIAEVQQRLKDSEALKSIVDFHGRSILKISTHTDEIRAQVVENVLPRIAEHQSAVDDLEQRTAQQEETSAEHTTALLELQEHHLRDADLDPIRGDMASAHASIVKLIDSTAGKAESIDTDKLFELTGALEAKQGEIASEQKKLVTEQVDLEQRTRDLGATVEDLEKRPAPERGEPGKPGRDGLGLDVKTWEPGIHRKGTLVQYALGKIARAKRDTSAKPDNREDWDRIGLGGLEFKAVVKNPAQARLEHGDIYLDDGTAFLWWNDKGRMLARRGSKGEKGEPGKDGRDGRDAREVETIEAYDKGLCFVYDDGSSVEVEFAKIYEIAGVFAEKVAKQAFLDMMSEADAELLKRGQPIKVFRGEWVTSNSYKAGDVVRHSDAAWIAVKAIPKNREFSLDWWAKLAGGGGGTGGAPQNLPTASPFNVVALNNQIPAQGAANGDTYFSFQDHSIRVWNAAQNRWDIVHDPIETVANEAAVSAGANHPDGLLRYARVEQTLWVFNQAANRWEKIGSEGNVIFVGPNQGLPLGVDPNDRTTPTIWNGGNGVDPGTKMVTPTSVYEWVDTIADYIRVKTGLDITKDDLTNAAFMNARGYEAMTVPPTGNFLGSPPSSTAMLTAGLARQPGDWFITSQRQAPPVAELYVFGGGDPHSGARYDVLQLSAKGGQPISRFMIPIDPFLAGTGLVPSWQKIYDFRGGGSGGTFAPQFDDGPGAHGPARINTLAPIGNMPMFGGAAPTNTDPSAVWPFEFAEPDGTTIGEKRVTEHGVLVWNGVGWETGFDSIGWARPYDLFTQPAGAPIRNPALNPWPAPINGSRDKVRVRWQDQVWEFNEPRGDTGLAYDFIFPFAHADPATTKAAYDQIASADFNRAGANLNIGITLDLDIPVTLATPAVQLPALGTVIDPANPPQAGLVAIFEMKDATAVDTNVVPGNWYRCGFLYAASDGTIRLFFGIIPDANTDAQNIIAQLPVRGAGPATVAEQPMALGQRHQALTFGFFTYPNFNNGEPIFLLSQGRNMYTATGIPATPGGAPANVNLRVVWVSREIQFNGAAYAGGLQLPAQTMVATAQGTTGPGGAASPLDTVGTPAEANWGATKIFVTRRVPSASAAGWRLVDIVDEAVRWWRIPTAVAPWIAQTYVRDSLVRDQSGKVYVATSATQPTDVPGTSANWLLVGSPGTVVTLAAVAGQTPTIAPPANPNEGDVFANTVDGSSWVYDADSSTWNPLSRTPTVTITNTAGENPGTNPPAQAPAIGDFYINAADGADWIYAIGGGAAVAPAAGWQPATPAAGNVYISDTAFEVPANPTGNEIQFTFPAGQTFTEGDRFVNRIDHSEFVYAPDPANPGAFIWVKLAADNTANVVQQSGIVPDNPKAGQVAFTFTRPPKVGDIFVNRADGVTWVRAVNPVTGLAGDVWERISGTEVTREMRPGIGPTDPVWQLNPANPMPDAFFYDAPYNAWGTAANQGQQPLFVMHRGQNEIELVVDNPTGATTLPNGRIVDIRHWVPQDTSVLFGGRLHLHLINPTDQLRGLKFFRYTYEGTIEFGIFDANGVETIYPVHEQGSTIVRQAMSFPVGFDQTRIAANVQRPAQKGDEFVNVPDNKNWVYDGIRWVERVHPFPDPTGHAVGEVMAIGAGNIPRWQASSTSSSIVVGAIAAQNTEPHEFLWADLTPAQIGTWMPGAYLIIDHLEANGKIPAGVMSIGGRDAAIGDWVVLVDGNGDGVPDALHLVRHDVSAQARNVNLGGEPALASRYDGMLWHDGVRLWIWRTTPTAWIEC